MPSQTAEKIDLGEITSPLKSEEAATESNRCLYCYDAPCVTACPTHIDIPKFIRQISTKNLTGSAKTILEANPMGHSCARVCPVESLCEGACVYHRWHEKPIEIARLQRFATDHFYGKSEERRAKSEKGGSLFSRSPANGKKIAVIGAGPAGLSCAVYLSRLGYSVTVFEKKQKPGGLNTYGIAEYKMNQKTALEEVRLAQELGVEIKTGIQAGKDVSLQDMEAKYEAVFIGVGLGSTQSLGLDGEELPGVLDALTFIEHIKSGRFSQIPPGRTTVVIGAGNTAIDAVTQAKRTGTPRVVMAYRRSRLEMPAYDYEFELAKLDGIEFLWNAAPVRILGGKKVEGVEFAGTESKNGKIRVLPKSGFILPCDRVIKAIGQTKQVSFLAKIKKLKLDPSGRLLVDAGTLQTSNPKYFAGGDAVNGGKEVVNAAADGKKAAWGIHRFLSGEAAASPEHAYWVSTIEGRKVAPPHSKRHEKETASFY